MKFAGAIGMVLALAACSTPKDVAYFQDRADGTSIEILNQQVIRVQPSDKLSIVVNSKNPELGNMFNLPYFTHRIGTTDRNASTLSASQNISCYTVDDEGNIDFPQLGKLRVTGMQRQEIGTLIKNKLRLLKNGFVHYLQILQLLCMERLNCKPWSENPK